jgi:hypothetical protein
VTLSRNAEPEVDELDKSSASIRTSETLDSDAERSDLDSEEDESDADSLHSSSLDDEDSRGPEDVYSDVDDDSLEESGEDPDDSFVPDEDGSDYDQLEGSSAEEDEEDDEEEDEGSVDLEWEEAQEISGAAISSHTRVLKIAAAEGLFVTKAKTIVGVVEVVRSIVNTIGPFSVRTYLYRRSSVLIVFNCQDGPVNADVILDQLRSYSQLLLDENRQFVFEDGQSILNKYLAIVKYSYPEGIDDNALLDEALQDEDVRDEDGRFSLKALVRRLRYGSPEVS